jgi:hypothetical protein
MAQRNLPYTSVLLIELLDERYPEKSPNPEDSEREVWMKAGERRLVRRLLNMKATIQNNQPITESGGFIA